MTREQRHLAVGGRDPDLGIKKNVVVHRLA
jgi:hypothetical protein